MRASPASDSSWTAIADLHPTQVTIGMREVALKRRRWREKGAERAVRFLDDRRVPAIAGASCRLFIIDRHHWVRALHDEGVTAVPVTVVADMSSLPGDALWTVLERRGLTHPFDDRGCRRRYADFPTSIAELLDDPYRSLAGAVKRAGGYAKDRSPFSEFRWADFLRCRIDRALLETDFAGAVALALDLALSPAAKHLPGWHGDGPALERQDEVRRAGVSAAGAR
jgi:hypothetical protein